MYNTPQKCIQCWLWWLPMNISPEKSFCWQETNVLSINMLLLQYHSLLIIDRLPQKIGRATCWGSITRDGPNITDSFQYENYSDKTNLPDSAKDQKSPKMILIFKSREGFGFLLIKSEPLYRPGFKFSAQIEYWDYLPSCSNGSVMHSEQGFSPGPR